MGGSSKQPTQQTQVKAPWEPSNAMLVQTMGDLNNAYNNYDGTQYNGSGVAPISGETQGLIQGVVGAGTNQQGVQQAQGVFGNIAAGGNGTNSFYQGLMDQNGIGAAQVGQNLMVAAGQQNPAMASAVQQMTQGSTNPFLDQIYGQAANAVTDKYQQITLPGLESQYSQAGRLGSGAFARSMAGAQDNARADLNSLATSIYGGAYENDANRRMQAMGLVGNLGQQGFQNQATAAGLIQSGLGQDLQSRLAGASGLTTGTGQQMQAASALAGLDSTQISNGLASLQASGLLDQQAQAELSDTIQRFYAGQNPDLTKIERFLPALMQYANVGGTGSQSQMMYGPSKGASALTGAASGAAMGTAIMPGWGTAIGAGVGGLASLF